MSKRIAGTAYLKVDGTQYTLGGSMTVNPYTTEREGKTGLSGVAGYTEKPKIPSIECEFYDTSTLSTEELEDITSATVTVELANGKSYVLKDAWTTNTDGIDVAEGNVPVKFEGTDCQEIL